MDEPKIIASLELDVNAHYTVLQCDNGDIVLQPYSEQRDEVRLTVDQARVLLQFLLAHLSHG